MKIAIIGTGGIGGYFGGKIARAGYDVTFVARGEHMNAIRKRGLIVKSIKGNFEISKVKITDNLHDLRESDLIILCVKAWQVKEISGVLNNVLKENAVILPLQNGISAYDEISAVLGKEHVLCGLCRIISMIEAPGIINHFAIEPTILFGEKNNMKSSRTDKILEVMKNSGIESWVPKDIDAELWKKFINICLSGLLAVTRSTYGQLRELKETRQLMVDVLEEVYILSQKAGINITHDFVLKSIESVDMIPFDSTSSLARDVWDEKPSEIEYQNGTVVRLAKELNIDVPVNRFIYYSILPMEKRARTR